VKGRRLYFKTAFQDYSAVFAPEGGRILTASADGTARLWDRNGKQLSSSNTRGGRRHDADRASGKSQCGD
jgi:WD40 repeat protein